MAYQKRILMYGPSVDQIRGIEVLFINGNPTEFAPVGTTSTSSQVWNDQQWLNATVQDFKAFDAIIFSDLGSSGGDPQTWSSALANRAIWGSAVDGNQIIYAGDVLTDQGNILPDALAWMQGMRFAAARSTSSSVRKTGLYVSLDHNDFFDSLGGRHIPATIPLLSWFGPFQAFRENAITGAGFHRLCIDNPILASIGPKVQDWQVNKSGGLITWPTGYYPAAYVFDASSATTPPSYFTPAIEADTGYLHAGPLSPLVSILVKADLYDLADISVNPPSQAAAANGSCSFIATYKYSAVPSITPYPTNPLKWEVITGPNAGKRGVTTHYVDNTWQGYYSCTTANVTPSNFQDVVRVFHDYDGNGHFDQNPDPNPCSTCPASTALDYGVTIIINWGSARVSISATDTSASEGSGSADTAAFRVSRNAVASSALTVNLAFSGSANINTSGTPQPEEDYRISGADPGGFSVTIPANQLYKDIIISTVNDTVSEVLETVRLALTDTTDGSYVITGNGFATATITDDDQPSIFVSKIYDATENGSGVNSGRGVFRIATGSAATVLAAPITVFFTLSGTATREVDYDLFDTLFNLVPFTPGGYGSVVLPMGTGSSVDIILAAYQDSRTEGSEAATLTLTTDPAYKIGPASASVTIIDDDSVKLPASYAITDLGATTTAAFAVNNASPLAVVGNRTATTTYTHGFRLVNDANKTLTDVGVIQKLGSSSKDYSFAYALNDGGLVAGFGYSSNSPAVYSLYYYKWQPGQLGQPGVMTELASLAGADINLGPTAVNNANFIVGTARTPDGFYHGVFWDGNGDPTFAPTDLRTLGSLQQSSYAYAINQARLVSGSDVGNRLVGESQIMLPGGSSTPAFHAFRTRPSASPVSISTFTDDLGNYLASDTSESAAYWINVLDEVVGISAYTASQLRPAYKDGHSRKNLGWRILGVLSGGSTSSGVIGRALGLNDVGLAVGWSRTTATGDGTPHAVVWENYQSPSATDLNTKIPAAAQSIWVLQSAECVNQTGVIVGSGTLNGQPRAFLLTPQ